MSDMKNITEIPSGFIARKTVNGKLYQEFFGLSRFGGNKQKAKSSAEAFIKTVNNMTKDVKVVRANNARNVTGFIGVAWHCRKNNHRVGTVVHSFRAQVASQEEAGRPETKAWSVHKHGLYGAYREAAMWREKKAFAGDGLTGLDVQEKFLGFLKKYVKQASTDQDVRKEMEQAILDLRSDPNIPVEFAKQIRQITTRSMSSSTKQRIRLAATIE